MRRVGMRIEDLKIFVDVVRYHSMNIAAEKNFTTPQNLSKIIKRMEDELNVVLFKRSKKGSDLTKKGKQFYFNVLEILRIYNDTVFELNGEKTSEYRVVKNEKEIILRVLCSHGALSQAIVDIVTERQNNKQKLVLEENEINFSELDRIIDILKEREYDIFACVIRQKDVDELAKRLHDYSLIHVIFDELVLVISKNHPLSKRAVISAEEINNFNLISYTDRKLYEDIFGDNFVFQISTDSVDKALSLIKQSNNYCTLLSRTVVKLENTKDPLDRLRMVQLEDKKFCVYAIFLHRKCINNKFMLDIVDRIIEPFIM